MVKFIEHIVKFKKEHKDIELPKYATEYSSGMDIRAYLNIDKDYYLFGATKHIDPLNNSLEIHIHPGGRALIPSGLKAEIPSGFEIQVRPRSGLALKHGVTVLNTPGTIDQDYKGDIGVILYNSSNQIFKVFNGDRIAQLVVSIVTQVEIEETSELSDTERGEGGFNSTGIK